MIHLPFADRREAGNLLGIELLRRLPGRNAIVLALARGGVPVGFAAANVLELPLDVIVVRKLGVPWQPELAMGALAGTAKILNQEMLADLKISSDAVEDIIAREQREMKRREELYRDSLPTPDLTGRTAILVDDGLATGSTMIAAIHYTRALRAAKIVVSVPVGSRDACNHVALNVDNLVCLATPESFYAVGGWYHRFPQVSDDEVRELLAESREKLNKNPASLPVN